jgi:hypothetical protein
VDFLGRLEWLPPDNRSINTKRQYIEKNGDKRKKERKGERGGEGDSYVFLGGSKLENCSGTFLVQNTFVYLENSLC